jgi:hypothetical protein
VKLVSTLRISTVTPGSTAPLVSATTPSITAVVIWDCAATRAGRNMDKARAKRTGIARIGHSFTFICDSGADEERAR